MGGILTGMSIVKQDSLHSSTGKGKDLAGNLGTKGVVQDGDRDRRAKAGSEIDEIQLLIQDLSLSLWIPTD
jgi:hypothetical protein